MAIIKAVNSRASIAHAIRYITQKEKTEEKLIGGLNCIPRYALEDMKRTKRAWNKMDGRQYKHFIQSFPPDEKITLETANEIAGKLVEQSSLFQGYEVCYATHRDREHIHTHMIVNSVSFEDGKKFRYSNRQLQELKDLSDQILTQYGFTICQKNQEITAYKENTYQSIVKGAKGQEESWLLNMALAINKAKETACSKEEFAEILDKNGISVSWTEKRKYILFQDQEGHKARNRKIEEIFKTELGKEQLLTEFTANRNMNHDERMELYRLALTEDVEKKAMALENIRLKEQYLKLNENWNIWMENTSSQISQIRDDQKELIHDIEVRNEEQCQNLEVAVMRIYEKQISKTEQLVWQMETEGKKLLENAREAGNSLRKMQGEMEQIEREVLIDFRTELEKIKNGIMRQQKWQIVLKSVYGIALVILSVFAVKIMIKG